MPPSSIVKSVLQRLAILSLTCLPVLAQNIRVLVWDERQPEQKTAYPNFVGNQIADHLKRLPGITVVNSVGLDDPAHGLGNSILDKTDVLIWWGHIRQGEIPVEIGRDIVTRIKAGKLALVALHASHWSVPFMEAMNEVTRIEASRRYPGPKVKFEFIPSPGRIVPTYDSLVTPAYYALRESKGEQHVRVDLPLSVFPGYRADGKLSTVTTLRPEHPLAKGIPAQFTIPATEAYDEPFHVPAPDEVVFRETWSAGGWFRSGMVWNLGQGKVFYFRPGHETYPVYTQEMPLKILENAVRWLGAPMAAAPVAASHK
jgi:trehalose utilization protein